MGYQQYLPLVKETVMFFAFTMTELAVLFVGISFLVGVINEFLPPDKVQKWLSGRSGRGYLIGSILGGLTPFCSCSTIPVMVGLLRAQAGFGPTMAFLFTSPLVNPIIIPLFFTLLGAKVTLIYTLTAIGMTIVISFILERTGFAHYVKQDILAASHGKKGAAIQPAPSANLSTCCNSEAAPSNIVQLQPVIQCCETSATSGTPGSLSFIPLQTVKTGKWHRIFSDAVDQFRKLLPFVILGVAIGSIIHGFLPADMVARLAGADNPLAVPVSAVIGIPLYLRASTMVPIAASLIAKGMSTGAVIALIIGGAGASLPEVAMLRGIFKLPLLMAFLTSVMIMAISAGFIVNMVIF